jgi:GTP cyclohydrolase III
MEPVSTAVAVSAVVSYLAKTLKENKSLSQFIGDFTSATVNWIRPIFLKEDDTPKDVLADLKAAPDNKYKINAAENAIAEAADGNPEVKEELRKMYAEIQQKRQNGQPVSVHVEDSERVNTGNITATGNVTQSFGDTVPLPNSETNEKRG